MFLNRKKKIKFYKVFYAESAAELSAEISSHIDDGWELQGGVATTYGEKSGHDQGFKRDCIHYAQAMIKK